MANSNRRTALLVEDDPIVAGAIQGMLAEVFNVVCANTAPAAIDFLQRAAPDLLLVDCSLAGNRITGMLAHAEHAAMAIVMISENEELISLLSAFRNSCCLRKPFGAAELWTAVGKALGGHVTSSQTAARRQ